MERGAPASARSFRPSPASCNPSSAKLSSTAPAPPYLLHSSAPSSASLSCDARNTDLVASAFLLYLRARSRRSDFPQHRSAGARGCAECGKRTSARRHLWLLRNRGRGRSGLSGSILSTAASTFTRHPRRRRRPRCVFGFAATALRTAVYCLLGRLCANLTCSIV